MEKKDIQILVVDDHDHNLELVKWVFKTEDYNLLFAENGMQALELLKNNDIDLILLDIMMPDMDGFETCEKIKSNVNWVDIPIIFLTARTEINDIVSGFNHGGVDYISKPFSKEELIVRVRNHIHLKLMRDFLKNEMENVKESRNEFMRMMLNFGKSLEY